MKNKMSVAKIISGLVLMASSVMATNAEVFIGASSAKMFNEDKIIYTVGVGAQETFKSKMTLGLSVGVNYGIVKLEAYQDSAPNMLGVGADLRVGYMPLKGLNIYAIGSAESQGFFKVYHDNNSAQVDVFGSGVGYGTGVSYNFIDEWSISAEYKIIKISFDNGAIGDALDYEYMPFKVALIYSF